MEDGTEARRHGGTEGGGGRTFTTAWLAERVGGELQGVDIEVRSINAMDAAGADEITFITAAAYARQWVGCGAGAAVVSRGLEVVGHDPARRALIVVPDAEIAVITLLDIFAPSPPEVPPGVHPTAWVHAEASVAATARIGAMVTVERGAVIEDEAVLHPGVRIYADVRIGSHCVLHSNVVIRERCVLGQRVILHPGVVIGADGFGYRPDPTADRLLKSTHIGSVVLEDDVEIGANSCVDRGKFGATVVGSGTKIDNLVQVGHNVRIGRCTVIAALAGIGGSAKIGQWTQIAGMVGISDHLRIGERAVLAAGSVVLRDVKSGKTVYGYPADDFHTTLRQMAALRRLPDLISRLPGTQDADLE